MRFKRQKATMQIVRFLCAWKADILVSFVQLLTLEFQERKIMMPSWNAIYFDKFSPFSLTIFLMKQSNEKGGRPPSCLSVLHRGVLSQQIQAEKSQREICSLTLCLRGTTTVSVSQQANRRTCRDGRNHSYPEMYRRQRDLRRMRREALRSTYEEIK